MGRKRQLIWKKKKNRKGKKCKTVLIGRVLKIPLVCATLSIKNCFLSLMRIYALNRMSVIMADICINFGKGRP